MNFDRITQSSWIADIYNKTFSFNGEFKKDGFFVELGVGNQVHYDRRDEGAPFTENTPYTIGGSNTSELLEYGWNGIYVEPLIEFIDQCKIVYKDYLSRLKLINLGASDKEEECLMGDGESLLSKKYTPGLSTDQAKLYLGRTIRCQNITKILIDNKCPIYIDVMSIDVEGYEEKVIRGLNFNLFSPKVLIVETNKVSKELIKTILPKNYNVVNSDELNTVFIRGM